jgi:hypothetical protein
MRGSRDEGCLSEGELDWQAADFFSREPSAHPGLESTSSGDASRPGRGRSGRNASIRNFAGGLISYAASLPDFYRRFGTFVGQSSQRRERGRLADFARVVRTFDVRLVRSDGYRPTWRGRANSSRRGVRTRQRGAYLNYIGDEDAGIERILRL